MARRYMNVPDIGRCTVLLRGLDERGISVAVLIREIEQGRVFVLFDWRRSRVATPVTSLPTEPLLRLLAQFDWHHVSESGPIDE